MVFLIEAVALSYTKATTALPFISTHFQTTQGAWILTVYSLAGAVTAPLFGKLADKHGKRRMLLIIAALATLGSVIAATSQSFEMLLVGRALEGCLTGAMFLTYSLIRDTYPAKIVPFAAAVTVTGAGALTALIPTVVGIIIDSYGWRGVFVLSAVWVGTMFFAILFTTKESSVRAESRTDALGAFLFAAALGSLLTGISMGNQWGWADVKTLGLMVLGLALGALYVMTSLRRTDPILNVRMFTRRGILMAATAAAVMYGVSALALTVVSIIGLTPALLGGGYGLGLSATGLAQITTTQSLTSVVAGIVTGLLVRRVGPWHTARTGMVLIALGTAYLAFRHDSVPDMIFGALILGMGSGSCSASVPNLVIAASPKKEQASFSSGIQVVISGIGGVTPVLGFVVLGRAATSGPGGAIVYTDGAITTALLGCVALAVVGALLMSTVLRPRPGSLTAGDDIDEAQAELLAAQLGGAPQEMVPNLVDPKSAGPATGSPQVDRKV
ncbi:MULTISPECIES: MFS transporter [unclassified Rhodococcus (in: high G+C Gram-positive bacteria)]|uniref:MFS transporter n=1 Tax=unclassified Rhodococcus (in: high G+C Gram-positive bacteria) TaxID=192944 RepID=UPI0027E0D7A8|nr:MULTISPECIES: MFS transporter [unclassified Rhodococcus (in: high G+C Gram-positive bacteria)]